MGTPRSNKLPNMKVLLLLATVFAASQANDVCKANFQNLADLKMETLKMRLRNGESVESFIAPSLPPLRTAAGPLVSAVPPALAGLSLSVLASLLTPFSSLDVSRRPLVPETPAGLVSAGSLSGSLEMATAKHFLLNLAKFTTRNNPKKK